MATSGATMVAAMAAKARREAREYFNQNNAFDPNHAVAYDAPTQMHRRQLELLIRRGIVREADGGRYWLDPEADRREEVRRRTAAKLVLQALLIFFALAIACAAIIPALR